MVDRKENYKFDLGVKGLNTVIIIIGSFESPFCTGERQYKQAVGTQ